MTQNKRNMNKKKERIYKFPKELLITDPCNVCGILKIEDGCEALTFGGIIYRKKEVVVYDEVNSERIHFNFEDKKTKTSREFFEKAKEVLKCWTRKDDFYVMISDKKDEPMILVSDNMGVIIAPRVDED